MRTAGSSSPCKDLMHESSERHEFNLAEIIVGLCIFIYLLCQSNTDASITGKGHISILKVPAHEIIADATVIGPQP